MRYIIAFNEKANKRLALGSNNTSNTSWKHLIVMASAALAAMVVSTLGSTVAGELTQRPVLVRETPTATRWVGFAASINGRVFQSSISTGEESARQAARGECEQTTGRTCNVTIAVPSNWDVAVAQCGSRIFMGGSALGYAWDKAMEKASNAGYVAWECRQIASY